MDNNPPVDPIAPSTPWNSDPQEMGTLLQTPKSPFFTPQNPPPSLPSPHAHLHLSCTQLPKEHLAHELPQQEHQHEGLDVQNLGRETLKEPQTGAGGGG